MGDMISALPDAVLCHILSFLPTKQAVTTSVLSKRWNSLWRSVPTLDFDDIGYTNPTYSRFVQSVNAFILSRDLHQSIKTFRLRCDSKLLCDHKNVNAWVNAAAQLRVEYLDISMPKMPMRIDLTSVIRCRTLVVLKLAHLSINVFSSIEFPLLKTMHLKGIRFSDHTHLAELFSACPNIEGLEIKNLFFLNNLIEAQFKGFPKLVTATIDKYDFPLEVVKNVEFLRIDWMDIKPCYSEYQIPIFLNLTHIQLNYYQCPEDWSEVLQVLKHCQNLQIFYIDKSNVLYSDDDDEEEADWPYPQSVPECLSLHLQTCYLMKFKGSKGEFRFVKYILKNARFLKTMKICCNSYVNRRKKFKMLKKLSLSMRCSPTCKLSFK